MASTNAFARAMLRKHRNAVNIRISCQIAADHARRSGRALCLFACCLATAAEPPVPATNLPVRLALPEALRFPHPSLSPLQVPTGWGLHQALVEGYQQTSVNLTNVEAYFAHVFARLPGEVRVYPSENYYYFAEAIAGRDLRGNVRLAADQRDRGVLSFWYEEVRSDSGGARNGLSGAQEFSAADGLRLEPAGPFTWIATYRQRSVVFHLHPLPQDPPRQFHLRTNEACVMRTFDESGLEFFLLFNTSAHYFFWVLNEEDQVPEHFDRLAPDLWLGRRTGFVFWQDPERPPRKVLASVHQPSIDRNDFYDGPFDQLADNHVDQTQIAIWMERADPSLKGRINRYGYYTDGRAPHRVALTNYGTHSTADQAIEFVSRAKVSADPYRFISRGGRP